MFSPKRIINKNILNKIRYFSTSEKSMSFDSIMKSKNTLPSLNLLELGLKYVTSIFFSPLGICVVKPNHILSYYTFGKYDGYKTSGLRWIPPISHSHQTFCGDITLTHKDMHLTDSSSNPIRVSSFVIYNIINPVHNIINLDSEDVLSNWIENITRQVISTYSYCELTNNANKENFLSNMIGKINSDPKAELYGIEIQRAGLLEINYAPEIAETMLVKQKARATIEARKELVDATLHLIQDIGEKLDDKLTQKDKSKLITCLTVSMIGNQSPSHVINLN
jgi:hypothetical protein